MTLEERVSYLEKVCLDMSGFIHQDEETAPRQVQEYIASLLGAEVRIEEQLRFLNSRVYDLEHALKHKPKDGKVTPLSWRIWFRFCDAIRWLYLLPWRLFGRKPI